jgi:hypothetical protein
MSSIPPPKVPSTPYNQKKSDGPLPNLIQTLRCDNRDQLVSLLSLDPTSNNLVLDDQAFKASDDNPVVHKNRLLFATEALRSLLVYHTLTDPSTRTGVKSTQNAPKLRSRHSTLTHEEESLGLVPKNPFGIVGTRILINSSKSSQDISPANMDMTTTSQGTEAVYNPASPQVHVFQNNDPRDDTDGASVILYFIHPTPEHVRAVCRSIHGHPPTSTLNPFDNYSGKVLKHRIVFLPRMNALSKRILEDENIMKRKDVAVHTLDINLVPLEDDVITCLELDNIMMDCLVDGVPSEPVTTVAQSIQKLQDIVGVIPRIQSFGPLAEMVLERCVNMRLDEYDPYHQEEEEFSEVKAMVILDRKIDLITPMITPLTYEGLLDDLLHIEAGIVKVETDLISPPEAASASSSSNADGKPKFMFLPLNDADTLYTEVRDQHVEKFGSFLQEQAKALKESHSNFSDRNKDLNEIHQFVKQIPIFTQNLKSLTNHIHLAELVKGTTEQPEFRQRWQTERSMVESEACYEMIEDLIASQYPPFRILRLLCLQSLTGGGIKSSRYESLRREVVQTYGYEFLFLLQNLEKIGLLKKRESMWDASSSFSTIRKHLMLIQEEVDPSHPDDVSYVSSGYAPISCRVIQTAINGWAGKEEALRELPGRRLDILQCSPPEDFETILKHRMNSPLGVYASEKEDGTLIHKSGDEIPIEEKPVLIVYFVGGLTYAEIASFRYLSKRRTFPYRIVCCTTKIINGGTFLQSLQRI